MVPLHISPAPNKTNKHQKTNHIANKSMRLGSWNVRTMRTGFPDTSGSSDCVQHLRKTAVIDGELLRLNVMIAALQETRLPDEGSIKESNFTFFWKGKDASAVREHGVGFAVRNELLKSIETPKGVSERIMLLRLYTDCGFVTGVHGVGNQNENGQRLLEFCSRSRLCVTNTFFKGKFLRKVSWKHPRSGHWHQLDVTLTKQQDIKIITHTRSYHSADCDTDHSLVISFIRLAPKKIHSSKPQGVKRINLPASDDTYVVSKITSTWDPESSAEDEWSQVKQLLTESAAGVFGYQRSANDDWFNRNLHHLQPLLDAKRKAAESHRLNPSASTKSILTKAKSLLQNQIRHSANAYWSEVCSSIQSCAATGNASGLYAGIRKALGPIPKKTAPLKENRWHHNIGL
ncbi:hypothetical protein ACJJTC_011471 [Scirpophaga incertulas]